MPENIPIRERRKLVRDFRKHLGLTLTEFGGLAGVSHPMLSQFETGKGGHNLSDEAWKRVLNAVKVAQAEYSWKPGGAKARKIADKLGVGTHEGLAREIGPPARRYAENLRGLIGRLQANVRPGDVATKEWLDAELAAVEANEKAMEMCSRLEGVNPRVGAKMVLYIPANADVVVNPSMTPTSAQVAGSRRAVDDAILVGRLAAAVESGQVIARHPQSAEEAEQLRTAGFTEDLEELNLPDRKSTKPAS
jgi:transcriptional regulator with XRE-family HTH domain